MLNGIVGAFLGKVIFNAGAALGRRIFALGRSNTVRSAVAYTVNKGLRGGLSLVSNSRAAQAGAHMLFRVRDVAQIFTSKLEINGQLPTILPAMKNQFVGISKHAFDRAKDVALTISSSGFGRTVKGFGYGILNTNLFGFQQLQSASREEEIGTYLAQVVAVNPNINFNIGKLLTRKASSP